MSRFDLCEFAPVLRITLRPSAGRRRLHRLEQEQADIEYDIRMLMEQPESNKTDSDKAREDGLIARKIEVCSRQSNPTPIPA